MIRFKRRKKYISLLSDLGRILHVHTQGATTGEIHLDKAFWRKITDIQQLLDLLSKSYKIRNLGRYIRIERIK